MAWISSSSQRTGLKGRDGDQAGHGRTLPGEGSGAHAAPNLACPPRALEGLSSLPGGLELGGPPGPFQLYPLDISALF